MSQAASSSSSSLPTNPAPIAKRKSNVTERQSKRAKKSHEKKRLAHDEYVLGWVAALPVEQAAARAMLDEMHQELPQKEGDANIYTLGRIGDHNVVIAGLPSDGYGTVNAATVASNMHRTFPSLRECLMVGIAGGAGSIGEVDVRLGDIVVSEKLIQYDLKKELLHDTFETMAIPLRPSQRLRMAMSKLKTRHLEDESEIPTLIQQIVEKKPKMKAFSSRESLRDLLFQDTYDHSGPNTNCHGCDPSKVIERVPREHDDPEIHYGVIASGNSLIKSPKRRDELVRQFNALCFEMEGAGMVESLQCLVIRSICDYADSHKNKSWQPYAAAAAAAYAKELILAIPVSESQDSKKVEKKLSPELQKLLMDSLSFGSIMSRELNIKPPYGKTCEWILHHPDYLAWLDPDEYHQHHGFLWIRGKPGAGKSTLMKFIYTSFERFEHDYTTISFFFNARGDDLEKSTEGMYRSLLFQLFQCAPDLQKVLDDRLLHEISKGRVKWDNGILQNLFSKAIAQLEQRELVCFVDALDECNEDDMYDMVEHFERLGEIASENNVKLLICLSSRHYPSVSLKYGLTLTLETQYGHSRDLQEYVDKKLDIGKGGNESEIRDTLLQKAAGVFIWIFLVIQILNKEYQHGRIFAVKKRLNEIPTKLSELFKEILKRDRGNTDELLLSVQWILYARKPLEPQEYYYAMISGLNPTVDNLAKWDPEDITIDDMERYVLSSSRGLAEVTKSRRIGTIQFIHESVRDFFLKDHGIRELWPDLENEFECRSHDRLKDCCYTYMEASLSSFKIPIRESLPNEIKKFEANFPFALFSVYSVLYHYRIAATSCAQHNFLRSFDFEKWLRLCAVSELYQDEEEACEDMFSVLSTQNSVEYREEMARHDTTAHGYREEIEDSFPNDLSSDNRGRYNTRSQLGNLCSKSACSHLLVELEHPFHNGLTPLGMAAYSKHTDLVRLLLDMGVNANATGGFGLRTTTPLSWAALGGSTKVVQLLLDRGAEVDLKDDNGESPLFRASESDNPEVVQLLLDKGAKVDLKNNNGESPLFHASNFGYAEVIQLLLDRGADPNIRNCRYGETPLFGALKSGYTEVIQLLLDRGADPNIRNGRYGETPLFGALVDDDIEVAQLLLDGGANMDAKNINGETPLFWASNKGNTKVVQLLLDKGANPDIAGNQYGETPLFPASRKSIIQVIKQLLDRAKVDAKNNDGQTVLFQATRRGEIELVRLLLDKGADIDAEDNSGKTALFYTTESSWRPVEVAQLLLDRGAKVDAKDNGGETPLQLAIRMNRMDIAELLLKRCFCCFWQRMSVGSTACETVY